VSLFFGGHIWGLSHSKSSWFSNLYLSAFSGKIHVTCNILLQKKTKTEKLFTPVNIILLALINKDTKLRKIRLQKRTSCKFQKDRGLI